MKPAFTRDISESAPDRSGAQSKTWRSALCTAISGLLFCIALVVTGCAHKERASAAHAPVAPVSSPPSRVPTLFVAGDSTAAVGAGEVQQGWAVPFTNYFDATRIRIVNWARGGRSSRTFITEGWWNRLLEQVQPGDIVLIQFGHNDGGAVNDAARARGSLPGLGEEIQEIDNLRTKQHEIVHTFGFYMRKMITDTQAKHARPVVLSLTVRNIWKDGKVERGSGRFSQWAAEIARTAGVPFIDVTDIMADEFDSMSEEKVKELYPRDHTHFNETGADLHAAVVASGLQRLQPPILPAAAFRKDGKRAADSPADQGPFFRFQFGDGKATTGFTLVSPDMIYSKERGFGFEPGAELKSGARDGAASGGFIASDKAFFFSVAVPEGNYRVTATLGGSPAESETTVSAELRRLMLERVQTHAGKVEKRTFIVNVRQPRIASGGEVRLTPREKTTEAWAWDERLSIEFNGSHPAIAALEIQRVDVPTVFLIGDSTVCDQPREPYNSWGQMITRFFKPDLAIANHAESGESIAPALAKGRFDRIWGEMKKGDYLFVQFGHNDMKSRATNALEIYTDDLRKIVVEARKRGGIPVLCTSVSRRTFDEQGKITNSFHGYPDAVRTVAREMNVPLIDLQNMGAAFYEAMGPEGSHRAFANASENTHHNDYGSYEIAQCVLEGIRQNHLDLARSIVPEFKGFDPSHPDPIESFKVPPDPLIATQTPPGS